jgi:hypothetical protein
MHAGAVQLRRISSVGTFTFPVTSTTRTNGEEHGGEEEQRQPEKQRVTPPQAQQEHRRALLFQHREFAHGTAAQVPPPL